MNCLLIPSADRPSSTLVDRHGQEAGCAGTGVERGLARQRRRFQPVLIVLALGLAAITGMISADAQDERRSRVPALGKITGGPNRQAFSGKVQSVDLKRSLLKVDTVEGGVTEIFPVKKGTPVSMAGGGKIKVNELAPGTSVIVYYEQGKDRRTVTGIVVLAASAGEDKKEKSPPPS
ncbi:MAG: hypothetical protein ABSA70_09845 [Terriglobia bacterium]